MSETKKPTALVTGACGFIGSHTVDYLLENNFDVTATDIVKSKYLNPKVKFIKGDITDRKQVESFFDNGPYNLIFHPAAIFNYSTSLDLLCKVNVGGTNNLLEAVKKHSRDSVVVVWSSEAVCRKSGTVATTENAEPCPLDDYGRSKYEQEKSALEFARAHELKVVVIRPAAVYGTRSTYGLAVPIFQLRRGQIPAIIGPGHYVQSFVHSTDVVKAAYFLAQNYLEIDRVFRNDPPETRYVFNLNDDSAYPIEEMFWHVVRCLHKVGLTEVRLLPIHLPIWSLRPLVWWNEFSHKHFGTEIKVERDLLGYMSMPFWASNAKIRRLGFEFAYPDTKAGVEEVIRWYYKEGLL